ncbi:MAG: hypothetical protein ABNH00_00420 [Dokdonia sp.]|jgi:hypothetical protein|nr:hypothetical protein [Cytophagaceae bacterium]
MKVLLFLLTLFMAQHSVAQRVTYSNDRKQTTTSDVKIKLTEDASLQLFVEHLKLDETQKKQVGRLLSQHRLRPAKGQTPQSKKAMSYEKKKRLFDSALNKILSDRQYAIYLRLQ